MQMWVHIYFYQYLVNQFHDSQSAGKGKSVGSTPYLWIKLSALSPTNAVSFPLIVLSHIYNSNAIIVCWIQMWKITKVNNDEYKLRWDGKHWLLDTNVMKYIEVIRFNSLSNYLVLKLCHLKQYERRVVAEILLLFRKWLQAS